MIYRDEIYKIYIMMVNYKSKNPHFNILKNFVLTFS